MASTRRRSKAAGLYRYWPVLKGGRVKAIPKGWKPAGTLGHHSRWSILIRKVE
jgi:hypothetical protein